MIISVSFATTGQQLPTFESNITNEQQKKSIVKNRFGTDYAELISYTVKSFWLEKQTYHIIAFNGRTWERILWTIKLDSSDQIVEQKLKMEPLNRKKFEDLLAFFNSSNFYNLELDSLNLMRRDNGDGSATVYMSSDGSTDEFELISGQRHRLISSYQADYFQKEIPNNQRQNFIECCSKFWELIGKKSG